MTSEKPTKPPQPRDVQVIQSILKDMGVTDYEPAVIHQLLDFAYKYTTEVLDDAKSFSVHAGKKAVDVDDTKLAVQLKLDKSFTNPPPRELLLDIASHKNSQTLPLIKPYTGPKLPADRYCLASGNFRLKNPRKVQNSGNSNTAVNRQTSQVRPPVSLVSRNISRTTAPGKQPTPEISVSQPGASTIQAAGFKRKLTSDDDYDT